MKKNIYRNKQFLTFKKKSLTNILNAISNLIFPKFTAIQSGNFYRIDLLSPL